MPIVFFSVVDPDPDCICIGTQQFCGPSGLLKVLWLSQTSSSTYNTFHRSGLLTLDDLHLDMIRSCAQSSGWESRNLGWLIMEPKRSQNICLHRYSLWSGSQWLYLALDYSCVHLCLLWTYADWYACSPQLRLMQVDSIYWILFQGIIGIAPFQFLRFGLSFPPLLHP